MTKKKIKTMIRITIKEEVISKIYFLNLQILKIIIKITINYQIYYLINKTITKNHQ